MLWWLFFSTIDSEKHDVTFVLKLLALEAYVYLRFSNMLVQEHILRMRKK